MTMTLTQPQSLSLKRTEVAALLGISEPTFDRARKKLEEEHAFPSKLPGLPYWSKPAVIAWIKSNGNLTLMNQILVGDPGDMILDELEIPDIPAELARRYGGAV